MKEKVIFKSLKFLGFEDYKVDNEGNIWSRRRGSSRLSNHDIIIIRKMYKNGIKQKTIAGKYNLSREYIGKIVNKKLCILKWKRIQPIPQRYKNKPMYHYVTLYNNNSHKKMKLHQLILLSFIGPRPENMESCHNDGNSLNNRLANLRYGTRTENERDKKNHGTDNQESRCGISKLTEVEVLEIRQLYKNNIKQKDIARIFHITSGSISNIVNRKNWKHI